MYKNPLLALLHSRHDSFVAGYATPVSHGAGTILRSPQTYLPNLIFPETGLIAILASLEDGRALEVGLVGHTSASVPSGLTAAQAMDDAEIAVTDIGGWSIKLADIATILETDGEIRSMFLRNSHFLLRQSRQLAACNTWHSLGQRFAGWLLRASQFSGTVAFQITQEQIAIFLGASRVSLSVVASNLLDLGVVDYKRGQLKITDPVGLAARACDCHRILEQNRRRLLDFCTS